MPFPESWPVFTPRDKVADWLEMYASAMDLDVALGTTVASATQPTAGHAANGGDGGGQWTVHLQKDGQDTTSVVRPTHVVFATGMSGYPRQPQPPGAFDGECLHSSAYPGAGGGRFKGRRAVVVGSNTSAHDICQDLWEQGAASVTMLQRSAGLVVSEESILEIGMTSLCSDGDTPVLPDDVASR